jgi:TonB family protein
MSATTQHLLGQLADGRFPLRKLLGVSTNSAVFLTSIEPERASDPPRDAAIKLVPEDPTNSDVQLDRWQVAAALSHPGLLRMIHFGRCAIDGSPCLYVVTELADEDLGQLLPRRPLTPDETRGMLAAVLPTLDFLHENGLVHAGLKPSNIHATGDNVKLSADRILPAGESSSAWPFAAPFAAPESILFPASDIWSLGISLCETLTKNLPVRESSGQFALPDLAAPFAEIVRSALVEDATLRITLDQVRSLLDPSFVAKRKTTPARISPRSPANCKEEVINDDADIGAAHSPYVRPPESPDSPESLIAAVEARPAAESASARAAQREPLPEIDPLAVPLSPVSPPRSPSRSDTAPQAPRSRIPVSSLPHVNATIGGPRRVSNRPASTRSNKLFLVSAAAAIVLLGLFVPRYFLRSRNSVQNSANPTSTPSTRDDSSARTAKTPSSNSTSAPSATLPPNSTAAANSSETSKPSRASSATNAPPSGSSASNSPGSTLSSPNAHPRTNAINPPPSSSANSSTRPPSAPSPNTRPSASTAAPETRSSQPATLNSNPAATPVLRKVLPEVSEKSRSTIHGTVRINVRVQINPDGTVSTAELANPASSQFFAAAALKAARQWQFAQPSSSRTSSTSSLAASSAIIRFDFTPTSTSAYLP